MGKDRNPDGVSTYPADQHDLDSYRQASQALSKLQVPVLVHASNPHERLFVAAFDGTGNSIYNDASENHTNVAMIYEQIQAAQKRGLTNIGSGYVEGPGTQDGAIARTKDLISGTTFESRVEEMYKQFVDQAKAWLKEDPNAQISLAITGFSRGAEQAAALAVLVHERGIQDPEGAKYIRNKDNLITRVEYTKPSLVKPGQIAQAVGLFDPVGTGEPRSHNRTLPPSVISGFQITAEDERRDQFKSTNILEPGFRENNHFLNVTVGGAHCNIGGGYRANGISIRNGNAMIDFFNGLSDRPYLDKTFEPSDPKLNVVHRSEEHQRLIYTTRNFDRDGTRARIEDVDNPVLCQRGAKRDCWNKDPLDQAMDRRFEHRATPIAPPPAAPPKGAPGRGNKVGDNDLHPDDPKSQQQQTSQQRLQTGHPDYPLFAALRRQLPPEVTDEKVAHVMLQAKQGGIVTAERLDRTVLHNGHAFILGHTPGFHAKVDLSGPIPPIAETLQQSQVFDQQRVQQFAQYDSHGRQHPQQQSSASSF